MSKVFNISGDCKPEIHYMVDISERLDKIKKMVDKGQYFTINRARQYGKTTTLRALKRFLEHDYVVINLDFQLLGSADFETEQTFVEVFSSQLLENIENVPEEIGVKLEMFANSRRMDVVVDYLGERFIIELKIWRCLTMSVVKNSCLTTLITSI